MGTETRRRHAPADASRALDRPAPAPPTLRNAISARASQWSDKPSEWPGQPRDRDVAGHVVAGVQIRNWVKLASLHYALVPPIGAFTGSPEGEATGLSTGSPEETTGLAPSGAVEPGSADLAARRRCCFSCCRVFRESSF